MLAIRPTSWNATSPAIARPLSLYVATDQDMKRSARKGALRSYVASGSITIAAVSAAPATSGATNGASRVKRSANAAMTDRTRSEVGASSFVAISTTR